MNRAKRFTRQGRLKLQDTFIKRKSIYAKREREREKKKKRGAMLTDRSLERILETNFQERLFNIGHQRSNQRQPVPDGELIIAIDFSIASPRLHEKKAARRRNTLVGVGN